MASQKLLRRLLGMFLGILSSLAVVPNAIAQCGAGPVTISVATATLPSYNPLSVAETPRAVRVSITNNSGAACNVSFSFLNANSNTATMTNGASTLNYKIENAGNTKSIFFTGGTPLLADRVESNIADGQTRNINVDVTAIAGQFVRGGTYTGTMEVHLFKRVGTGNAAVLTGVSTASAGVSVNVVNVCQITNAANISQTIAVNSVGQTTGMQGSPPQFNVACNNASNVSLTSQNGGVTRTSGGSASGFRNKINYSAQINGGAGPVTLNTATSNSATGPFNAASLLVPTITQVTITPESSSVPLLAGSYSDVLTVTITPQ